MKEMKIIKFTILSPILMVFFNFLEYGLVWNRLDQFIYPIILTVITYAILFIPKLRKLSLIVSFILFLSMILFYLINQLSLSDSFGSFGFSLLLITLTVYLPQMIKKGFIEKF